MPSHNQPTNQLIIIRPVLWALGIVGVIFVVYEIVEHMWLRSQLEQQTIHFLHLLRGILTSLIAASLVGWFIFKASPPLYSSPLPEDVHTDIEHPTNQERLENFTRWFILMRWVAILVALVLTYLVVHVSEWLPGRVMRPLILLISGLAVLNLIYEYLFRKGWFTRFLLSFQAYFDLIILVAMLHYSGGIENPLSLLMLFHVIIAGIVLNRNHCYTVAAAASILLALVATGEATGILDHYTLTIFPHVVHGGELAHASHQPYYVISHVGLLSIIFFLTAYFVTTLADRLRQGEYQLATFAKHMFEQRQLIEKALETTHTGLCVCDDQSSPYWTNSRWEQWFGNMSPESFINADPSVSSEFSCKPNHRNDKQMHEITLPGSDPRDSTRTIRITTAPLMDHEGKPVQSVSVAQDVTDQRLAQEQMVHAGKLAAVGELAGHMAHEINNPIGIISAKCRLLLDDHLEEMSPKVQQELEKVISAADRVAHIAKGLLSYCRPSPSVRFAMDISYPIREAITMISQRADLLDVKIDDRLPKNLPLINANSGEIQQVFLNLFLNALDAMPSGGVLRITAIEINENCCESGKLIRFSVQDSGSGISDDIKDRIFEPFFTTKDMNKGTGLGLSICDGLIRSHDGMIDVKSSEGSGTLVTITLPVSEIITVAEV